MNNKLTAAEINDGVNRFLAEAYATATVSDNPELIFVCAGPGAGKTSVEKYFKNKFKENEEKLFEVSSDKVAMYHPNYEEILEELPEVCYSLTREFVKPALPKIYEGLRKSKISIINEKTFSRGADVEEVRAFKDAGYKISVNIMATDLLESRLSCYEREAYSLKQGLTPRGCSTENQIRMHTSYINGIRELEREGLIDEIKVYIRGENINKPPIQKYKSGDENYIDFEDAVIKEEAIQREKIIENISVFISRIEETKKIIQEYGQNENLTNNALEGLSQLQNDVLRESAKHIENKVNLEI